MGIFNLRLSPKGQITVPVEIRRLLGAELGGQVQFSTRDGGQVVLVAKKRSIKDLRGLVPRPAKPVDDDAAIAAAVLERNRPGGPV